MTQYKSQVAQDAQSTKYGDKSYWDYLEETALRYYDYYKAKGFDTLAESMLTRTLSEALAGNDGE